MQNAHTGFARLSRTTAIGATSIQSRHTTWADSIESAIIRCFIWAYTRAWQATSEGAQAIIARVGAHLVVVGLVALAVVLSGIQLPQSRAWSVAPILLTPTPAINLGNRLENLS